MARVGTRRDAAVAKRALEELLSQGIAFRRRSRPEPRIWLLFVHLDTLSLVGELADTRLQVRVRFGSSGIYQEKFTHKVASSPAQEDPLQQGSLVQLYGLQNATELNGKMGFLETFDREQRRWHVTLFDDQVKAVQPQHLRCAGESRALMGAMLAFRWDVELPPMLTLDLLKLGFMDTVLASTTVRVPFQIGSRGVAEQECLFLRRRSSYCCFGPPRTKEPGSLDLSLLGHIGVAVELRDFTQSDLEMGMMDPCSIEALVITLDMVFAMTEAEARAEASRREARVASNSIGRRSESGQPTAVGGMPVAYTAAAGATPTVVGRPIPGTGWSAWPVASEGQRPPGFSSSRALA